MRHFTIFIIAKKRTLRMAEDLCAGEVILLLGRIKGHGEEASGRV